MIPASSVPGAAALAAAALGALALVAVLAVLIRRRPELLPLLAIFALPFRLPISTGGKTVNLLIPLYLVVAAGTLAVLLPRALAALRAGGEPAAALARGRGRLREGAREPLALWLSPAGVEALLFGAVGLYVLQAIYSGDHTKAAENIAFFYFPFALLFVLLRGVPWTRRLLLLCLAVAAALAVVFAGIGFVEYARKSLFLNPKLVAANQYDNYFRVNSLFFDPNIYGRFLAIVMVAITTVVLWIHDRRDIAIGGVLLLWLLGGLVTSFSQSSVAALMLGLAILAAYRWDVRTTIYVVGGVLALGAAVVLLAPASLHFGLKGSSGSTSNATSGRTKLISGGLELFADRPLQGWGSGSFETEYKRRRNTNAENATSASHTIPVTVAAEQGVIGLAVYLALIVAALVVLLRGAGRSPPRLAIGACFAALLLHTWTYADFLEDPFTWALLAIGLALARASSGAGAPLATAAARGGQ